MVARIFSVFRRATPIGAIENRSQYHVEDGGFRTEHTL